MLQTKNRRIASSVAVALALLIGGVCSSTGVASAAPATRSVEAPAGLTPAQAWVQAVYEDFLGRPPTAAEMSAGEVLTGQGDQASLLDRLATSDEWLGHLVTGFYTDTLGRTPDLAGLDYWVGILRSGRLRVPEVAAQFYASDEYFATRGGGTNTSWVNDLYNRLTGRDPDYGGVGYWVNLAGTRGRYIVAYTFYQSLESRQHRVDGLYLNLLDRHADWAGQQYWADLIRGLGDVALAEFLAVSDEYHALATATYGGS